MKNSNMYPSKSIFIPVVTLFILLILNMAGCTHNPVVDKCSAGKLPEHYFGEKFSKAYDTETIAQDELDYFEEALRKMKEPSLFDTGPGFECYRFLWLRSFDNAIVIRVDKYPGHQTLTVKECTNYKKSLYNCSTRSISGDELQHIYKLLYAVQFYRMPPDEQKEVYGVDGAFWIFEAKSPQGGYNAVMRWSPHKEYEEGRDPDLPGYRALCNYFISLSGLKFGKNEIY